MSFSNETIILYSVIAVLFIVNLCFFFWLRRVTKHYNNLTKDLDQKTLMKYLESIQRVLATHERTNLTLKTELKNLEKQVETHLQELILKRFNPFGDTGGDQSFILALLDGNKDGVVITSLHSRENTRFYVKSVKGGVGVDHPLTSEEQKIIKR